MLAFDSENYEILSQIGNKHIIKLSLQDVGKIVEYEDGQYLNTGTSHFVKEIGDISQIDIMAKKKSELSNLNQKMVVVDVTDSYRSNPFMPARATVTPSRLPKFDIMAPPESIPQNSEAQRVMETKVSGIMYDNYSPTAIINCNGTDYLVKRGDTVNGYKILRITKDVVVVKLGVNVYSAGVGGKLYQNGSLGYNTVDNLNRKFAGNQVEIRVRKK